MAILFPPAAANTGGAFPTPPTSTAPEPMACSIGGPEVKSDQATLNGSLSIRPAAVSRACAPVPAWSPTCRVTSETLTWLALLVPPVFGDAVFGDAAAGDADEEAEEEDEDEQAVSTARLTAAARASTRCGVRPGARGDRLARREASSVRYIIVLPC